MSSFHGVKPGQPPLGVSKPGSRDGGALPDDFSNPSLGLALALVPPGTSPVAAFPPFVKSRHSTRVKCFKLGLFKNLQPAKSQSDYGGGIFDIYFAVSVLKWKRDVLFRKITTTTN